MNDTDDPRPTTVVVAGAGCAGLLATNRLLGSLTRAERQRLAVTVTNPRSAFVERIRLHHIGSGALASVQRPLAELLYPDPHVIVGVAPAIDADEHTVGEETTDDRRMVVDYSTSCSTSSPSSPRTAHRDVTGARSLPPNPTGAPMSSPRTYAAPMMFGALMLLATACSGGSDPDDGKPAPATTVRPGQIDPAPATSVSIADSPIGSLLVDGTGRTLYVFDADEAETSNCYDACAAAWPPLLTASTPSAGADVTAPDLGTTARHDGTEQVTYHGRPLYTFAGDHEPGDTNGHDLDEFGATWHAVGADGTPIGTT
jgi:predicted lipoprotein with Yx(FWY)xxD motif